MAKIDFNSYNDYSSSNNSNNNFVRVSFFSLADDGDEAIVRFPYSDVSEFDLDAVHTISTPTANGKRAYKKVSCLRNAHEPLELCPFCARGGETQSKVSLRFFCKLIRYIQDPETGKMIAQPCVWDRPAALSKTLKSYMDDYGDLRNTLFKIKRHGAKGDQNTTYDILPANQNVYKPEVYVPDFSGFDNFDLSFFFCLKKSADEMNHYLATGNFPEVAKTSNTVKAAQTNIFTPSVSGGSAEAPTVTTSITLNQPDVVQSTTNATVEVESGVRPRRYAY